MATGGDTIQRVAVRQMSVGELLWNAVEAWVCSRWEHRWRAYGRPLPFGHREFCSRCSRQAVVQRDGERGEWSKAELLAADPGMAEALYEARWGDVPRTKLKRGDWPAV